MASAKHTKPNHGFKDETGNIYGRLKVIGFARWVPSGSYRRAAWKCRCVCGKISVISGSHLRNGHTQSCGCYRRDVMRSIHTTHGESYSSEYNIWGAIISRCYNLNQLAYPNYGGRGIRVCVRWRKSFQAFLDDMGMKPSPSHTIERIDNAGSYTPENCKWATRDEQAQNKRNNRRLTLHGETLTLAQWERRLGGSGSTVHNRLRLGWSIERALTTPVRPLIRRPK